MSIKIGRRGGAGENVYKFNGGVKIGGTRPLDIGCERCYNQDYQISQFSKGEFIMKKLLVLLLVLALCIPSFAACDGAQGPQGEPGIQGEKGDAGLDGKDGAPGAKGDKSDR